MSHSPSNANRRNNAKQWESLIFHSHTNSTLYFNTLHTEAGDEIIACCLVPRRQPRQTDFPLHGHRIGNERASGAGDETRLDEVNGKHGDQSDFSKSHRAAKRFSQTETYMYTQTLNHGYVEEFVVHSSLLFSPDGSPHPPTNPGSRGLLQTARYLKRCLRERDKEGFQKVGHQVSPG